MSTGPNFNDSAVQTYLIEALWPHIAPFAYQQYLTRGKGAVAIDLNKVVDTVAGQNQVICEGEAKYKTAQELASEGSDESIDEYDPQESLVLVLDLRPSPDEPGISRRHLMTVGMSNQPSPKKLYEQKKRSKKKASSLSLPFKVQVGFSPPPVNWGDTELQKRFINQGWLHFASLAYRNYLNHGRGAIVVDLSLMQATRQFATTNANFKTEYVLLDDPKMEDLKEEEIVKTIQEYNPEEEVVFLFLHGDPNQQDFITVNLHLIPSRPETSPKTLYEVEQKVQ